MRFLPRRRPRSADILHDPIAHQLSREVDEFLLGDREAAAYARELEIGNGSAAFERRGHGKIR